jgi:hypothetical protein
MLDRWSRWAPFTGIVFAVLFVAGAVIAAINNTPASDASGRNVITFYESHSSALRVAPILLTVACIFLLFFVGLLRTYLRRAPNAEGLAALMPVAAAVLLVGETVGGGVEYALADVPSRLDPAAAQALNVLGTDLVLTQASARSGSSAVSPSCARLCSPAGSAG